MSKLSGAAFVGSFFTPDNGLFYFSPFLLLALPGLYLMLRRADLGLRADGVLCLGLVVFFALFISSLTFWRSGWAVGPRYITCALPYYLVPVAVLVRALDERSGGRSWGWTSARIGAWGLMAVSIVIYLGSNAVFPHYPENFSDPLFDVTLRFGRAGYLPYNLGWLLGLEGLPSAVPYLVVGGAMLVALLAGGSGPRLGRLGVALGALALAFSILLGYHARLRYRRTPVPVAFLP